MEKVVHMLKPLVPKFRSDLYVRLMNIAEKQVPVKLKPIVSTRGANRNPKFRNSEKRAENRFGIRTDNS